jgi:hypothetical protein
MEERQDAEHFVGTVEHEYLRDLPDIGDDVVVREHYALGIARASTGKNHRGQIVVCPLQGTKRRFEQAIRRQPREDQRHQLFCQPRLFQHVFQQQRTAWNFNLGEALQKCL